MANAAATAVTPVARAAAAATLAPPRAAECAASTSLRSTNTPAKSAATSGRSNASAQVRGDAAEAAAIIVLLVGTPLAVPLLTQRKPTCSSRLQRQKRRRPKHRKLKGLPMHFAGCLGGSSQLAINLQGTCHRVVASCSLPAQRLPAGGPPVVRPSRRFPKGQ